jgi:hypothetical protein
MAPHIIIIKILYPDFIIHCIAICTEQRLFEVVLVCKLVL